MICTRLVHVASDQWCLYIFNIHINVLPYFLEYPTPPNKQHTPFLKKKKKSTFWRNKVYMLSMCKSSVYF
jgi:hypothetical protein